MLDTQTSDLSSVLSSSLSLENRIGFVTSEKLQEFKDNLQSLPSVADKNTLLNLKNGKYDISLKQYTNMNTYNTMMTTLYGNNSASKFQNTLNLLTNTSEDKLATAKTFIDKMKEGGMSDKTAVKTYFAIQKYSIMSSFDNNYSFVSAKA